MWCFDSWKTQRKCGLGGEVVWEERRHVHRRKALGAVMAMMFLM
jgi:hypothetical protein